MEKKKIKHFTDLLIWQRGNRLVSTIYSVANSLPKDEKFGLSDQMRRAVVSFTSNIAEGFGRPSQKDKAHFYTMALASLYEVQSQILNSRDLTYITDTDCQTLYGECTEIVRMTQVLIQKVKYPKLVPEIANSDY